MYYSIEIYNYKMNVFSGLFHGAMALSGNILCDQYFQANPQEAAKELASKLECTSTDDGKDILDCLERQTQQDLVNAANDMTMFFSFPRWFVPTVDGKILPDLPENLLVEGKFNKV